MNANQSGATPEPQSQRETATVIRRPQRTLGPQEREVVQGTALLNLHGALIMGIIDPVPNPSPMSEAEGAWVREQVWPAHFQRIERKYPWGFHRWALCERGTCWNCLAGRCDLCVHRQKGGPDIGRNTDWVHNQQGRCIATLILRPDGGPCLWWCRCACPKDDSPPMEPPAPLRQEAAPARAGSDPHQQGAVPMRSRRRREPDTEAAADWSQNPLF